MQSATTRRFTPVPLAAVLVVAAGLAGGIIALNETESLPGQGGSASITQPSRAVTAPYAGEGLIGPGANVTDTVWPIIRGIPSIGQGEGLIGPGSTVMDSFKPVVRGIPSFGQGEGLIGPGAHLDR